jgi:hypothetical protein
MPPPALAPSHSGGTGKPSAFSLSPCRKISSSSAATHLRWMGSCVYVWPRSAIFSAICSVTSRLFSLPPPNCPLNGEATTLTGGLGAGKGSGVAGAPSPPSALLKGGTVQGEIHSSSCCSNSGA